MGASTGISISELMGIQRISDFSALNQGCHLSMPGSLKIARMAFSPTLVLREDLSSLPTM
jgi:hypothetical protein